MEHLELPIAGSDNVPFRHDPFRFHGRAAVRRDIVAGEGNGVEHEVGRLDAGPTKLGVGLAGRGISKRRANPVASVILRRSKRRRHFGPFA
jgi:hypothetical protein